MDDEPARGATGRTIRPLSRSSQRNAVTSSVKDESGVGASHEPPTAMQGPDLNASSLESPSGSKIHPLIAKAEGAFRRDFDQLMRARFGQWVAYHGDEQIGFATTDEDAYALCVRKGIDLSEVLVRSIEAVGDEFFMGPAFTEDLIEDAGK